MRELLTILHDDAMTIHAASPPRARAFDATLVEIGSRNPSSARIKKFLMLVG
jgi:hypothetical protein